MLEESEIRTLMEFYIKRRIETKGNLYWSGASTALNNVLNGMCAHLDGAGSMLVESENPLSEVLSMKFENENSFEYEVKCVCGSIFFARLYETICPNCARDYNFKIIPIVKS